MYSTLVAWLKSYTDLYLKAYYNDRGEPNWYMRDKTVVTLSKDDDDTIPAGMAYSVYLFAIDFNTSKLNNTETLTTAFESLLSDLTKLYIKDNPILTGTTYFKITNLSHIAQENENLFNYHLEIDLRYMETL
jgi:hypothetical protein